VNEDDPTRPFDPDDLDTTPDSAPSSAENTIGPYRILQKIGEGGMGEVYAAEQTAPIRRKVALKIIKKGMDTRKVIVRFEAERQALALMNHPCIAKVFDAGETPRGRPYFAMEYVPGIPITEYCDRHRLNMNDRLDLFVRVCEGVQHAHQKAVIHRDLKPTNVLVAEEDGKRVPKIIDFGVAKATSHSLTEKTMFTQLGQLIGTLEYMSPEQADLTGEDVDTRTDVYSLGVILYELLVGALPFTSKELCEAGVDGIRKIIREKDPVRPSTKLNSLGDEKTSVVEARRSTRARLLKELSGEVDWIVLKALEKDRGRRYASTLELANDVQRYLNQEPIQARPPSSAYRARKFIQRNRAGVTASIIVLVALLGAVGATTYGLVRAIRAESQAKQDADRANLEATTSAAVSDFLADLFGRANPFEARGKTITAHDLLDIGSSRIETEFADQPAVQARMLEIIGACYRDLGDYEPAVRLSRQALSKTIAVHGTESMEAAEIQESLAYLLVFTSDYDEAETLIRESIAILQKNEGDDSAHAAGHMGTLSFVFLRSENFVAAEEILRKSLSILRLNDEEGSARLASVLMNMGWALAGQRKDDEAEILHREALEMRRRIFQGDDHPSIGWSLQHLGALLNRTGEPAAAIVLLTEAVEMNRRLMGDTHPEIAYNLQQLGISYHLTGDFDRAEASHREAIIMKREVLDDDHPELASGLGSLADLLLATGNLDEVDELLSESLSIHKERFGRDHRRVAGDLKRYGAWARARDMHEQAVDYYVEALRIQQRVLGKHNPETSRTLYDLACLFAALGKQDEAISYLAQAVDTGWNDAARIKDEPDLESLREHPAFLAVLAGLNGSQ